MYEELLIRGGRLIDPSQNLDKIGDLLIRAGKIERLSEKNTIPLENFPVIEASGHIVSPGFIDLHCHLREPGFEDKDTIATGTRAAAKGGFTTVCCMPNTNPALDSQSAIDFVLSKAKSEGAVNVLPIGCITKGRQGTELAEMAELARAGVVGFSDDGNPVTSSKVMRYALEYSLSLGLIIIDHCEDKSLSDGGLINEGWVSARLGLKGIPAAAEEIMVARDIALARLTGARLHLAHISTAGSVDLIRLAKDKGIAVTAEVTPHHLTLTEEGVMGDNNGQNISKSSSNPLSPLAYETNAKVNPPLRRRKDIEALVAGLKEGLLDAIATDHAPHTIVDKRCELGLATFGISGLETALGCLMGLVHAGELELKTLITKLTCGPAQIIGPKFGELGTLRPGCRADIVIFDPNKEWLVNTADFVSKGKNSPYHGQQLKGKVMATIAGGKIAYIDNALKPKVKP